MGESSGGTTVATSHNWGDMGGTVFARGGGFKEQVYTFRDGKTLEGGVAGSGSASTDHGSGQGGAIVTSLWFCGGWPGFPPSTPDQCNDQSTLTFTDWEIIEHP